MADSVGMTRSARTVLEQRIRERRQTFEEFVAFAETFAQEHGEQGTLSVRHLQRLVTGRLSVETIRPATVRLIERIFDTSVADLLAAPVGNSGSGSAAESQPQLFLDISLERASDGSHARHGNRQARLTVKAHVLRVAIAVVVKESETLVVCRRGEGDGEISWQFPAGIVKPGASPENVAVCETFEETGIYCRVVRRLGSRVHPVTNVVCDYMLCEYLTGDARNVDVVENVGVAWADRNDLGRFIPVDQIYAPVLDALRLTSPFASTAS
jgi:8-oxo-dGTP pyrophosphatase MutT (NUDIX family)